MEDIRHSYKMTIAYDGTRYSGWQIQPNGLTIQEILQQACKIILKEEIPVIGSGRTDAGVHALAQVAHFTFHLPLNIYRLLGSINGLIPPDIRVKKIETAPSNFHAQYSAKGKIYHYHLCIDKVQDPFRRLYSLHVREKINLDLLKEAAQLFVGTHDFISFANEAHSGTASYDSVRTIKRLDVVQEESGVRLEFEADGFLYKMVRNITGTLLDVARGKINLDVIPRIFKAKDRTLARQAAPPHGLFLVHVYYE